MDGDVNFKAGHSGAVRLDYFTEVNYAMALNKINTCNSCEIENHDSEPWHGVTVTVVGKYIADQTIAIGDVPAGQTVAVSGLDLRPDINELLNLTESVPTDFSLTICCRTADVGGTAPDGTGADTTAEIYRCTYPVRLMAYDHWLGLGGRPELLASFVTPNDPALKRVIVNAAKAMERLTGNSAMDEYQSADPNRARAQVAAIFKALREEGIVYVAPPAGFEQSGQRIRLSGQVLADKMGTCLDTTVLFASCLESIGLLPLVVLVKGHAFVGAWLVQDQCMQNVDDDASFLMKKCADGVNEMVFVETTALTLSGQVDFEGAVRLATERLKQDEATLTVLDIHRCRLYAGIRPLPQRIMQSDGHWTVPAAEQEGLKHDADIGHVEKLDRYALKFDDGKKTVTRQMIWERKLLDFSLRNNLVNTRLGRRVVPFVSIGIDRLEDFIMAGDSIQIRPFPKGEAKPDDDGIYDSATQAAGMESLVMEELKNKRLFAYMTEADLGNALKFIYRSARTAIEENGANSLFLALGFLRWYETERSQQPRYAPLLLVPVDIVRRSISKGYVIRARDEETMFNITLAELLKQQFGIDLGSALTPLPKDDSGVDVKCVFSVVRQCIGTMKRWNVLEECMLGLFSFSKFVMWNDIHTNAEKLKRNSIIASFMENRLSWHEDSEPVDAREVDANIKPQRYAIPLDVDSSQMEAIIDSGDGKSFILHGPPGTGKSQTITNMIANALYQGKRVLFVAEKMAALEVVQKRLKKIGLDAFCLELHSNKVTKQHFLAQMQAALDVVHTVTPQDYEATANRLFSERQSLIRNAEALHRKQDSGLSLYECISRFVAIDHDEIQDGLPPADKIRSEQLDAWAADISSLDAVFGISGHPAGHPLSGLEPLDVSTDIVRRLKEMLEQYRDTFTALKPKAEAMAVTLLGCHTDDSMADLELVARLVMLLQVVPVASARMLDMHADEELKRALLDVFNAGRSRDMLRRQLTDTCAESILDLDVRTYRSRWDTIKHKWFLPRFFATRSFMSEMRRYNAAMQAADVDTTLDKVAAYQKDRDKVAAYGSVISEAYTTIGQQGREDWTKIEQAYQAAPDIAALLMRFATRHGMNYGQLRDAFVAAVGGDVAAFRLANTVELQALQSQFDELKRLTDGIAIYARMYLPEDGITQSIPQTIGRWLQDYSMLRDWYQWTSRKHGLESQGLQCVCRYIEDGHKSGYNAAQALLKGVYRQMVMAAIDADPQLRTFNGVIFDDVIAKYRQETARFQNLTKQELYCRLAANVPSQIMEASATSEMGILKRNINNGGRGTTIRKIIDQIPTLLPKLCPCMLMSPISVAQYLDLDNNPFDLVVFDEASQMPTSEAVGAIARGRALVVVGDPKQMPPTSFFSSSATDEDEADVDDMESILDDCITLSVPSRYLTWHYRSKHESLIAFSNREYYDGRLYTFPSVDDRVSKVSLVQIDGTYDKGRTRSNPDEARAIVQEVIRRLSDDALSRRSIGIVSFSKVQQTLIEDLLDGELAKHPDLEAKAYGGEEPVFIKNLENVQGDERDVILFSVGYGPDKSGKVSMNFGPLNNEGGERRLNVAVSRARYEMIVFSTLKAEQIDLRRTSAKGVAGLKKFLEFAERGVQALPVASVSARDFTVSDMMSDLKHELEQRGYKVDTMVGRSEFRVDLAVVNPDEADSYLLGILGDGEAYYGTKTARDREICQPNVLGMLHWQVMRLWTLDWFMNREATLQRVLSRLEAAAQDIDKHDANPQEVGMQTDASVPSEPAVVGNDVLKSAAVVPPQQPKSSGHVAVLKNDRERDYTFASIRPCTVRRDLNAVLENTERLAGQIAKIVEKEQPVTNTYIYKRIVGLNLLTRTSPRLQSAVDELLAAGGYYRDPLSDERQTIYWNDSTAANGYRYYRVNSKRDIADIPVIELMNAAVYAIEQQVSMPREDLKKVLASLLGIMRRSQSMDAATGRALQLLLEQGKLVDKDGRIALP